MKSYLALIFLCFGVVPLVHAASLDDQYVQIFDTIQEADKLSNNHPKQALAKYKEAETGLETLQRGSPEWNSKVVGFRLTYVREKIAGLSTSAPMTNDSASATSKEGSSSAQAAASSAAAEAQLAASQEQVRQLQTERAQQDAKLKEAMAVAASAPNPRALTAAQEKITSLEKENEGLKKQVASLNESKTAPPKPPVVIPPPQQVPAQTAALKAEIDSLRLEKTALEDRLKQVNDSATTISPASIAKEDDGRMKQLEHERDNLRKELETAQKELQKRKGKSSNADLQHQLATAQARVEVLEAQKVPYSAEELALLKAPPTQLAGAAAVAAKRPAHELPTGTSDLVAQAQQSFAAHQYDKAEQAYTEVLKHDDKNVLVLANLAAVQIEAQHLDAAEKNIQKALSIDPEDAYSLYVMGIVEVREHKYDVAISALSHAAKLDPQNAEVQNYLGLALSEKGLRGPAETALRKAIELQPSYGSAHYNLAVFYLTQQPPYPALARWHYQKALATGHPANPDVEKRLDKKL